MALQLNSHDHDLLVSIAEHRILTVRHLVALHGRNAAALRRRLGALEKAGLIRSDPRSLRARRGRPEKLLSLSEKGVELLKERALLDAGVHTDVVTVHRIRCLEHLLLVNDFRVQLVQTGRLVDGLSSHFLSPTSPFLRPSSDQTSVVHEQFAVSGSGSEVEYTPDGVFTLSHAEFGKSLLFYLEADMGTEALASRGRARQDVRQKLVNYQATYRTGRYKRYENVFGCSFRGFRLLVLASNVARMAALCRLVKGMPPSDFVWVSDRESMDTEGIWASICARGGHPERKRESILGDLLPHPHPKPADLA